MLFSGEDFLWGFGSRGLIFISRGGSRNRLLYEGAREVLLLD